ncbi:hypothetical protein TNCV_3712241 [Trichonephila clavipes]|nr:hypothetical protein TNCV_3712241 [Trichonephila clavipes]
MRCLGGARYATGSTQWRRCGEVVIPTCLGGPPVNRDRLNAMNSMSEPGLQGRHRCDSPFPAILYLWYYQCYQQHVLFFYAAHYITWQRGTKTWSYVNDKCLDDTERITQSVNNVDNTILSRMSAGTGLFH